MVNSIGMDSLSPQIRTILRHSLMATALFGRAKAIRLSQPNRPFLRNYGDRPQKGRLRTRGSASIPSQAYRSGARKLNIQLMPN
jgi:hypothetical protein